MVILHPLMSIRGMYYLSERPRESDIQGHQYVYTCIVSVIFNAINTLIVHLHMYVGQNKLTFEGPLGIKLRDDPLYMHSMNYTLAAGL